MFVHAPIFVCGVYTSVPASFVSILGATASPFNSTCLFAHVVMVSYTVPKIIQTVKLGIMISDQVASTKISESASSKCVDMLYLADE